MTTRYGSLIGTKKQASPPQPVPALYENGKDQIIARDTVLLAAAPIADVIELVHNLPWESVLSPNSTLWFDNLGANTTLSIGDATHPAALAAATDTHTAAGSMLVTKTLTIQNYFAPLWQALGYASLAAAKATAGSCQLIATIAGGAATGNVTWQISGQRRL